MPHPVMITWYDAFGDATEWTAIGDLSEKRRLIKSCGLLLKPRVKGYHTLALSYDKETRHVTGVIHIPHANVVEMVDLVCSTVET